MQKLIAPPEYGVIDPWGTPFRFVFSKDRKHYRIISAGADRQFESTDLPWSSEPAVVEAPGADVIYEDGVFVRFPPGTTEQEM